MRDELGDFVVAGRNGLHDIAESRGIAAVLQGEPAARRARCRLDQHAVAGEQRRQCEPERLPVREVPRHDAEHGAERLVAHLDPCPVGVRRAGRRRQDLSGDPGQVGRGIRALGYL